RGGDLGYVPFFDGERLDSLNLWGGPFNAGNLASFNKELWLGRSGIAGYRAHLGAVPDDGFKFFQTFSSEVAAPPGDGTLGYRQDRDLTRYDSLEGYVRNATSVPLTFSLELKDYRDSLGHVARRSYTLPTGGWTRIEAPLDLAAGWTVTGSPDLSRTFAVSFLVKADSGAANGSLYLDEFAFREKGPTIDVQAAPIETIVERLAERQFSALWHARHKQTGIIPNRSDDVHAGALNTTTGVVWTLPSAVRRGWVSQTEADGYMSQLVASLNANRDQTSFLPTRFLDLNTAAPISNREESSVDAAFIALALHNYKSQAATPAGLRNAIDSLESRFDFSAFATPAAFRLAYIPSTGFTPHTYSGYTNENKVIALAGELADNVPLASMWNKDVGRELDYLVDAEDAHLVYSYDDVHRAPFAQALINLFVDTSDRGVDSYPDRTLARNPWVNFVKYEDEVADKLVQLGREHLFQPDAGSGPGTYQPWNLYHDFGQPTLFQPWSAALALLAGAEGAEESLRLLLDNGLGTGLDGPLGMADWAQWSPGAPGPSNVPSFADNWNMTLSLMALMEFLEGDQSASRRFADLPEVDAALDSVFLDGDLTGNGLTNGADLTVWRSGFGAEAFASPASGDADGDGDVDGRDFLRWQRGVGLTIGVDAAAAGVPEPGAAWLAALGWAASLAGRRRRPFGANPETL
ncbi:MAG TPA: hypothetical protein VF175_04935, partial [Lacipirellula sp.]